jgi:hypothetical protein
MGDDAPDVLAATIRDVKDLAARHGRDPGALDFRYTLGLGEAENALRTISHDIGVDEPARATLKNPSSVDEAMETIAQFAEAGFTELCISFAWNDPQEYLERMEWFAADVMPAFS